MTRVKPAGIPEEFQSTMTVEPELIEAGKRASDAINLHLTFAKDYFVLREQWVALSLADGRSDGVLYESKKDAIKHQLHEFQCLYVSFRNLAPGGVKPYELSIMLQFARDAYAAGIRLVDPDDKTGGADPIMTAAQYDYYTGKPSR